MTRLEVFRSAACAGMVSPAESVGANPAFSIVNGASGATYHQEYRLHERCVTSSEHAEFRNTRPAGLFRQPVHGGLRR